MATFSLRFWIILGRQGARKGSLIRNLTGVAQNSECDVRLANGQRLRLWTQITSLNEGSVPSPEEWVASCFQDGSAHDKRSWYNMLVALRLDLGKPGYEPDDYIREFIKADSWIESIVTLGEATRRWVVDCGVPYGDVPDVSVPTNEIGATARQFWGWR